MLDPHRENYDDLFDDEDFLDYEDEDDDYLYEYSDRDDD